MMSGMAGMPSPPAAAGFGGFGLELLGKDPKTAVNEFCQRHCRRPVTKTDMMYNTTKFPGGLYQTVVKLACMDGQEFAGEACMNPKEAEKSASQQVLNYYANEISMMPSSMSIQKTKNKNKRSLPSASISSIPPQPPLTPGFLGTGPPPKIQRLADVELAGDAALGTNSMSSAMVAAMSSGGTPPGPMTSKTELNSMCAKILRRPMGKSDVEYESCQVPGGFQATVRMAGLPDEWGSQVWAGEVCERKGDAEQSVAAIALAHLRADPTFAAIWSAPPKPKPYKGAYKKGKGKGWGGYDSGAWSSSPGVP
eukprot:TRINITY_DN61876_c0_g1_i1.p1 TRINITY_DN61876_c0_g1~~TRINITY_DN61876_c0_g1_i1.p1  ORF type:complete len:309 (-),score=52.37 TRINITY_DN61876_c0_g1_i1:81-1007(-)